MLNSGLPVCFPECFQHADLHEGIQLSLLHLFGAIMCGHSGNALKAICPATIDVLLKVLQTSCCGNRRRGNLPQLVIDCLVMVVHMLYTSAAEQVSDNTLRLHNCIIQNKNKQ